jgi:methionyl aminopeptidase
MNSVTPNTIPTVTARPPVKSPKSNDLCWCASGKKYKKCHQEDDVAFFKNEKLSLEASRIRPGNISPMRLVPDHIVRPDYAVSGTPGRGDGNNVRTAEELVRMRQACKAAATLLRLASEQIRPGMTTEDIDIFVHNKTIEMGGYPSTLNYHGYRKSLCTSVNEVICHGIPDDRKLLMGDILNLDVTIFIHGMHGDCNGTFAVGPIDAESQNLITVTRECLMSGIGAVKPGRPISDIGRAIELHATKNNLGVVRSYCGHGIGPTFHTNLQIPHYYDPKSNTKMEPNMTFTIEPMITLGNPEELHWNDGWTAVTKDLRRTAQFEHTILVTDTGVEILTVE